MATRITEAALPCGLRAIARLAGRLGLNPSAGRKIHQVRRNFRGCAALQPVA
jgi:hypothetical protein